jgi:thioredoxin 1
MRTSLPLSTTIYSLLICLLPSCNASTQCQQSLSPAQFVSAIADTNAVILDVRTKEEFNAGHLANALLADWNSDEFDTRIQAIDHHKTVNVYCLSGGRSAAAAAHLRKKGFTQVNELAGGILAWRNANLPEVKPSFPSHDAITPSVFQTNIEAPHVLIDFYAPWCAPCRKLDPIIQNTLVEFPNLKLVRINIDENPTLAKNLKVESIPQLFIYKNGTPVWSHTGIISQQDLIQALKK